MSTIIDDGSATKEKDKEKRRSWIPKIPRPGSANGRSNSTSRPGSSSGNGMPQFPLPFARANSTGSAKILATPKEGEELTIVAPRPRLPSDSASTTASSSHRSSPAPSRPASLIRNLSFDSPPVSRPSTPKNRSSVNLSMLTSASQELDNRASQLILDALERTNSQQTAPAAAQAPSRTSTSFGKSLTSMMGLSSLAISRTNTRESTDDRGRSMFSGRHGKSHSQAPPEKQEVSRSRSRARSQSPFTLRNLKPREPSPPPQRVPLSHSDAELSESETAVHARTAFAYDSGDDVAGDTTDNETEESSSDEDFFDPITERNTEQNAIIAPAAGEILPEVDDPDPVGEGVNVVVPPEPYFPSSLNALGSSGRSKRNPRKRKSLKQHEPLPLVTSRPVFQRDRCTITITQGDPDAKLAETKRKRRYYTVASDLSEESRYAVEWGIGTVLRDGDEMLLVTIIENESRVDPAIPNTGERGAKLRSQQERQGMAYILARQVTSLLQRTRLNVTVACQAWHAKHARHMLLDIVDYTEPTMLIVGSRGLSHLNGQKCSVPVMVARRRLKRPPRKAAHLSMSRTHIKLAEAGIDRVAGKVDEDVTAMRDELQKEEQRREGGPGSRSGMRDYASTPEFAAEEEDADGDNEEEPQSQVTSS